ITNDNAAANFTAGEELEARLERRKILGSWRASSHQLGYVYLHVHRSLGTEVFMSKITQTGLVESKQAIWEYDP
ncbi:hypothetical protein OH76DRAFT_1326409, partial [Lentinus brumalis]